MGTPREAAAITLSDTGAENLIGRRAERQALRGIMHSASEGKGTALLLLGPAGIGKTALVRDAIASATSTHLVTVTGVESEMELPYASLHLLSQSLLADDKDLISKLPTLQRDAFETALGLSSGPPPGALLMGLTSLALLDAAAHRRPLLCVVDDAQWLDSASAHALGIAARRLAGTPVTMVLAMREPNNSFAGLATYTVGGLDDQQAHALLSRELHGPFDLEVRERIVTEARGNPLALLELPRSASPDDLAGGFAVVSTMSVSTRIERAFAGRVRALPGSARLVLLTAAADPTGDANLLRRALPEMGAETDALSACEDAGLMEVRDKVRFRHPLVRSVAYAIAAPDDRRRAHQALANATDPVTDPSRRVWHAAQATSGPDEHIASQLEAAAELAQARGGYAARAAFLRRAAELSGVPDLRVARVLGAAQAMQDAGTLDAGLRLLGTLRPAELTAGDAAHVEWLRAYTHLVQVRGASAAGALVSAATGMTPHHPAMAGEMWLAALEAARFGGRFGDPTVQEVAKAMRTTDAQAALQPVARDLMHGLATMWVDDFAEGVRILRPALKRLTDEGQAQDLVIRLLRVAESAAVDSLDDESHHQLVEIHEQRARVLGTLANLNTALASGVEVRLNEGDIHAAHRRTQELDELAELQHGPRWHALTALVAAWQGDQATLAQCADEGIRDATSRREGLALSGIYLALAIDANAHCEFEAAARHAELAAVDEHELGYATWALPELIEAAARAGQHTTAQVALARLQRLGHDAQSNWGLGLLAQATALLSDGQASAEEFERSIDHLERTRVITALARTHLLYGEWLRRTRKRAASHHQLTLAHEIFEACGAHSFAERSRNELEGIERRGRPAQRDHENPLTGRELTVARMAAGGHSNRAIARHLFISEKTVEYHLGKVFGKLNVRSRTQLASRLPSVPTGTTLDPAPPNPELEHLPEPQSNPPDHEVL